MQRNKTLHIAGYDVSVTKKRGVKNLYLKVCPPAGEVRVTSPWYVSYAQITKFVESKAGFIERSQEKVRERAERKAHEYNRDYVSGETFYLWGQPLRLEVVEAGGQACAQQEGGARAGEQVTSVAGGAWGSGAHEVTGTRGGSGKASSVVGAGGARSCASREGSCSRARSCVWREGDVLYLKVPQGFSKESREKKVNEWYRGELKAQIARMAPEIEERVGAHASEYRTKNMKTRWGTCNVAHARIWINLQLAKKPPECLEYILVHELCHLHERNHTKRFWALVEQFYPEWKAAKAALE